MIGNRLREGEPSSSAAWVEGGKSVEISVYSQFLPYQGFHFLVAHKKVEQRKHAALKNFLRNNGSLR